MFHSCVFYEIKLQGHPEYLYKLIPTNTYNSDHIETYYCRTEIFKYSFFPDTIVEWNRLGHALCNSKSYNIF